MVRPPSSVSDTSDESLSLLCKKKNHPIAIARSNLKTSDHQSASASRRPGELKVNCTLKSRNQLDLYPTEMSLACTNWARGLRSSSSDSCHTNSSRRTSKSPPTPLSPRGNEQFTYYNHESGDEDDVKEKSSRCLHQPKSNKLLKRQFALRNNSNSDSESGSGLKVHYQNHPNHVEKTKSEIRWLHNKPFAARITNGTHGSRSSQRDTTLSSSGSPCRVVSLENSPRKHEPNRVVVISSTLNGVSATSPRPTSNAQRTTGQIGKNNSVMDMPSLPIMTSSSSGSVVHVKPAAFLKKMPPTIQVHEGSPLQLSVKIAGPHVNVVWVKENKVVQHCPPDIFVTSDSAGGIHTLKIQDAFLEDSGLYFCRARLGQIAEECECIVDVKPFEMQRTMEIPTSPILVDSNPSAGNHLEECVVTVKKDEGIIHACNNNPKENLCTNTNSKGETNAPSPLAINNDKVFGQSKSVSSEVSSCPFQSPPHLTPSQEILVKSKSDSLFCETKSTSVPKISLGPSNVLVLLGEMVRLRAKIQTPNSAPAEITWSKFCNGAFKVLIPSKPSSSEDEPLTVVSNNNVTCVTFKEVTYNDSGRYMIKAENQFGSDVHHCFLHVEGPPMAPTSSPESVYDRNHQSISVTWSSCPYDGGCAVTGYILEQKLITSPDSSKTPDGAVSKCVDDGKDWFTVTPINYHRLCFTVQPENKGNYVIFRVRAINNYGSGKPSLSSHPLYVPVHHQKQSKTDHTSLISNESSSPQIWDRTTQESECKEIELKAESFSDRYSKGEELGKGRFGVVFNVTHKVSGKHYAGKFIKTIKAKDKERVQLEFKIMSEMRNHPKLLCLVDGFEMAREIVIVTEKINGGELFERVVADDFTLHEHDCIDFLRQVCDGVKYIHSKRIMHLDLKPENILCTNRTSNQIKIIDFGLAQYYNPEEPVRVLFGTAEFVSPEIINYDTICPSTDMWSIGVITYILLSGLSPFMGDSDSETFTNITTGEFDYEDDAFDQVSDNAKEFISNLLVKRQEKRLSAEECLHHKWLLPEENEESKDIVLPTEKLKKFIVRRKWQKTGNAIRALGRITTLYSSRRTSSTSSNTSTSGTLRSLSTQNSSEYDNVFHPYSQRIEETTNAIQSPTKLKYDENCRSDSGICDVTTAE